jgi:tetratricopeptide (TPR) repeat protein
MALALQNLERWPDAIAAARRCLALRSALTAILPGQVADAHGLLGVSLAGSGDIEGAAREAAEAVRVIEAAIGPDDPALIAALSTQGRIWTLAGRWREAAAPLSRCVALAEKLGGIDQARYANCLSGLARALLELGQPAEALPRAERALALVESSGLDIRLEATAHVTAGRALAALGRPAEGRPHVQKTVDIYRGLGDAHRTKLAEELLRSMH